MVLLNVCFENIFASSTEFLDCSTAACILTAGSASCRQCCCFFPVCFTATDDLCALPVSKFFREVVHDRNASRVLDLALTLRGFYVKAGQLLSTREDFVPHAWTEKLAVLQDNTPPMQPDEAKSIVERELACACDEEFEASRRDRNRTIPAFCRIYGEKAGRIPIEAVFEPGSIDWAKPIGSASLACVYSGKLRHSKKRVAIKVQNPSTSRLVPGDLDSLVTVGKILERTDLKINFTPFLKEIQRQVKKELNFANEARTMNAVKADLSVLKNIVVPSALTGMSTAKLIVMDFVEGQNLISLRNKTSRTPEWQKKLLGKQLLSLMSRAWGRMIFGSGLMHGDPHSGNLLVGKRARRGLARFLPPTYELGIIDLGQAKQLSWQTQSRLARLVSELAREDATDGQIASALRATGLRFERMDSSEDQFLARAARLVFSTETVDGRTFNPFGKDSILANNGVRDIPEGFVFVIRVIQIQRGIAAALGLQDFSLAQKWKEEAKRFLKRNESIGSL